MLLADVDETYSLQLASFLELHSFTVRRAADIQEAMEHFINFQPGVVIVDANLPAKSWIELIQSIRRYEEDRDSDYRSIILVTSSRYTTELSQKAAKAGAHEVVGKPIDQPGILRKITEHAAVY